MEPCENRVRAPFLRDGFAPITLQTDAPRVIDPDAVLTLEVTFERFKPVGRRNPQILQGDGIVEPTQLATRHGLDIGRQPPGWRSAPDLFRFLVGEVPDHDAAITWLVI